MGSKTAVQPDQITWDEFTARRTAAETGGEPDGQPKLKNKRREEPALAGLLMQAIHAAATRRGRLSQAERVRLQTLLEILTQAMRSAMSGFTGRRRARAS